MNQTAKLDYLINYLLAENPAYRSVAVPDGEGEKRRLLRSLMNLRPPVEISGEFLAVQDDYLRAETAAKGVAEPRSLTEREKGVYLWKGDITLLAADGIVNAANSKMLGCFVPCHGCVDNAIHSAAGVQLRLKCREIMEEQGHDEQAGGVKITPAYNLPSKYVLHTVGPVVSGEPDGMDERLLCSCYVSCMENTGVLLRVHGGIRLSAAKGGGNRRGYRQTISQKQSKRPGGDIRCVRTGRLRHI